MKKKILIRVLCIIGSLLIVAPLSAYLLIKKDTKEPGDAQMPETVNEVASLANDTVLPAKDESTEENDKKEDDTITVDYFFYTEDKNSLNHYIPNTVKKDGKTYEYTGETQYDFLESMQCVEISMELQVEDIAEAKDSIIYTSPQTGITYVLSADSINFGDLTKIKKKVTERVDYTGCLGMPDIPGIKTIRYYNRETKEEAETQGTIKDWGSSGEYWASADEAIIGTFERDASDYVNFGTDIWDGDKEWTINVDLDNEYPSWEGYEKDVLKISGVPEDEIENYRITSADWLGDKYYDLTVKDDKEVLVEKRDASYGYEAKVRDYWIEYEGYGESEGYKAFVSYFASEEEALEALKKKNKSITKEDIKEDIKTLYKVKAAATYRESLMKSEKESVMIKTNTSRPEKVNNNDRSDITKNMKKADIAKDEEMDLLKQYKDYNKDCIGIISIEDSVLNHPLMQSIYQEDFYLTHDLNRKCNSHGVPFLTLDSDLKRKNGNNIIYGHNIRTSERDVFADLAYYEDIEYYKEHPLIKLVTDNGIENYVIFAYYIIDTSDNGFVYWDNSAWESVDSYKKYMEEVEKRNWLKTCIPYSYNDRFLTLYSCSVELAHSGTNRMVVMARLLGDDEDINGLIQGASQRRNPLLPQKLFSED